MAPFAQTRGGISDALLVEGSGDVVDGRYLLRNGPPVTSDACWFEDGVFWEHEEDPRFIIQGVRDHEWFIDQRGVDWLYSADVGGCDPARALEWGANPENANATAGAAVSVTSQSESTGGSGGGGAVTFDIEKTVIPFIIVAILVFIVSICCHPSRFRRNDKIQPKETMDDFRPLATLQPIRGPQMYGTSRLARPQ